MCLEELVRLQDAIEDVRAAGVDLKIVSAESPERSKRAVEKFGFEFDVLCDDQGRLMDLLGLRHSGQGPDGSDIFYSSQYLVDEEGQIVWAFTPGKITKRATPAEIVEAAAKSRD